MTETTVLDAFGISQDEILALMELAHEDTLGSKERLTRVLTARRASNVSHHIAAQLWECRQILSKVGLLHSIDLSRNLATSQPDWESILERIYGDPLALRNRTVWLLFHACLQAQSDFALDGCPARSHEAYLTGRFIERISAACESWAKAAASYLERVDKALEVSSIDLSVAGGEQETGGDFALVLDINEMQGRPEDLEPDVITLTGAPRGDLFIPLVFQAKRYTGTQADISQQHEKRGYQYNKLRSLNCSANYIFFENGKDRIESPALPIVKPASACSPVECSPNTDVFEGSVDFATHILRAANGFTDMPAARSREDALNMVLANASPESLASIAIIGNTSGLKLQYEEALKRLMEEIDSAPEPDSPEADDPNNGSRPRF